METRLIIKTGLFSALFAMVMLAAPTANAKVMIMGSDGWEVSFDGSVNSFYVNGSKEKPENTKGNEIKPNSDMYADMDAGNDTTSRVTVGLLPAVLGINIKSPTMNGLTMGARFGLYPSTQNNNDRMKNQFRGQNDFREVFFTVDGDFGQVLVGKTLSLYMGKNILTDMTLFGVGAVGAGGGPLNGTTTLGRIGHGYVYPNFNVGMRYSTPDMNGFKATVGVYDPSQIRGAGTAKSKVAALAIKSGGAATAGVVYAEGETVPPTIAGNRALYVATKGLKTGLVATTAAETDVYVLADNPAGDVSLNATETNVPRFEGELSWAGSMNDLSSTVWFNGMWQSAKRGEASTKACADFRTRFNVEKAKPLTKMQGFENQDTKDCKDVNAWGTGAGLQLSWQGLTVTGSGYYGEGLGTTLMLDTDSLDPLGNVRNNFGYIGQVVYAFGQGTSFGASYGGSYTQPTEADKFFAAGYGGKSLDRAEYTNYATGVKADSDTLAKVSNLISLDRSAIAGGTAQIKKRQNLMDFMVWHDINANLRVVAEYGRQDTGWMDGTTQNVNIFSVGGFFFW